MWEKDNSSSLGWVIFSYFYLFNLFKETDAKESLDMLIKHFIMNQILPVEYLTSHKLSNLVAARDLSDLK